MAFTLNKISSLKQNVFFFDETWISSHNTVSVEKPVVLNETQRKIIDGVIKILEQDPEGKEGVKGEISTMYQDLLQNPENVRKLLDQIEGKKVEELRLISRDISKGPLDESEGDRRKYEVITRYTKMSLKVLWDQFHLNTKG